MKKQLAVLLLLLSMSLTLVAAQGFQPPHPEPFCPTGCIAAQSNPNYLEIRLGASNEKANNGFAFVMPFAMHVTRIEAWIGTSSGDQFEIDSHLQWACGQTFTPFGEYLIQYDKHQDIVGNVQRGWTVDLDLTGCSIWMYHTAPGIISCPNGCFYDMTWRLYS